jgi:hypothetical protein
MATGMAQATVETKRNSQPKGINRQICPNGQHSLVKTREGEYVCTRCATVPTDQPQEAEITEGMAQQATMDHHMPVDELKIQKMGMQHDMTSQAHKGLAMELGYGSTAKDYLGKRIKPQLQCGYVTGQVVGKGSQVYEVENFDLTLSCFDKKTKAHHIELNQLQNPLLNGIKTIECSICKKESRIIDVYRYLVPKARKSFTDDTIYRDAKIAANDISTHLQLDIIARSQYGRQVEKVFSEWVGLSKEVLPVLALLRMKQRVQGLGLDVPTEILDRYPEILEKVRLLLVEPLMPSNE